MLAHSNEARIVPPPIQCAQQRERWLSTDSCIRKNSELQSMTWIFGCARQLGCLRGTAVYLIKLKYKDVQNIRCWYPLQSNFSALLLWPQVQNGINQKYTATILIILQPWIGTLACRSAGSHVVICAWSHGIWCMLVLCCCALCNARPSCLSLPYQACCSSVLYF